MRIIFQKSSFSSIDFYNLLLRLLGIRMKLLNFSANENVELRPQNRNARNNDVDTLQTGPLPPPPSPSSSPPTTKYTIKQFLNGVPFIIGFTFAIIFPTVTMKVIAETPLGKNGKKTVDYFIRYAYFNIAYIVTIVIYLLQYRNERTMTVQQTEMKRIFERLWRINRYWCNGQRNFCDGNEHFHNIHSLRLESLLRLCNHQRPLTRTDLNAFNGMHLMRIFFAIACCTMANYLEYYHIFERSTHGEMNSFNSILYFYPTVFIDLFIWQLSIAVHQYKKLFELLNQTLDAVSIDIRRLMLLHRNNDQSCGRSWSEDNIHTRIWFRNMNKCHLNTSNRHIEALIEIHDELRSCVQTFQQLNTIQVNAAILNAFANIIINVRFCFIFVAATIL